MRKNVKKKSPKLKPVGSPFGGLSITESDSMRRYPPLNTLQRIILMNEMGIRR